MLKESAKGSTSSGFLCVRSAGLWGVPDRPQKITLAEMRDMGERGLLPWLTIEKRRFGIRVPVRIALTRHELEAQDCAQRSRRDTQGQAAGELKSPRAKDARYKPLVVPPAASQFSRSRPP
jgi:hypothetical protein